MSFTSFALILKKRKNIMKLSLRKTLLLSTVAAIFTMGNANATESSTTNQVIDTVTSLLIGTASTDPTPSTGSVAHPPCCKPKDKESHDD